MGQRGVRYVVLRWFDRLPELDPGEDLDLLVSDEDLPRIRDLFRTDAGGAPCDVYSVSGLPGFDYRHMAYYPPYLASTLLTRAESRPGGLLVPCAEDHFFSLAFHALYHKGLRSGLPTTLEGLEPEQAPEHDYRATLTRLGAACGISMSQDMEGLDDLLSQHGWRPPLDALSKLAASNPWIERRFFAERTPDDPASSGLAVFILRQRAIELGLEQRLVHLLAAGGFHILATHRLDEEESKHCARHLRGGNWGPGPYPVSGGLPSVAVAAYDFLPRPPSTRVSRAQPSVENENIVEVKARLRDELRRRLPADAQCNMIHSSDNTSEAWEYLRIAFPDERAEFEERLAALQRGFPEPEGVVERLTRYGRRARVDLIEQHGRPAVRKTWRPHCERFVQREMFVRREFGRQRTEVPEVLDSGPNYLVMPYYGDACDRRQLIPLAIARQAMDFLRFLWQQGYDAVDFHPGNLLLDADGNLKVIDFEFVHEYSHRPERFEDCYALAGLPEDFEGDRPEFSRGLDAPYEHYWLPRVGLSLHSLLHDPPWLQHLKRAARLPWLIAKRRLRSVPRRLRRALRGRHL